ncbi:MAG: hypothetical protein AB7E29_08095 [Xanthobacter sp.]
MRGLKAKLGKSALLLAFFTGVASPALAQNEPASTTQGWSRTYGIGACVGCTSGTGVVTGEEAGREVLGITSGIMGALTAPFAPQPEAPPSEVFTQQPPAGKNCWVDPGAGQKGYWANCPTFRR